MVIRDENKVKNVRKNVRDGSGQVNDFHYLKKEQLPPHCSHFVPMVLEKGCGIGPHVHEDSAEIYYIIKGEAVYNDNGRECLIKSGDMTITYFGEMHAIHNSKNEPLVVMAAGWTQD